MRPPSLLRATRTCKAVESMLYSGCLGLNRS
nr:MAG TPA: hypothetical protein [Caudoviricetes sp.]